MNVKERLLTAIQGGISDAHRQKPGLPFGVVLKWQVKAELAGNNR